MFVGSFHSFSAFCVFFYYIRSIVCVVVHLPFSTKVLITYSDLSPRHSSPILPQSPFSSIPCLHLLSHCILFIPFLAFLFGVFVLHVYTTTSHVTLLLFLDGMDLDLPTIHTYLHTTHCFLHLLRFLLSSFSFFV